MPVTLEHIKFRDLSELLKRQHNFSDEEDIDKVVVFRKGEQKLNPTKPLDKYNPKFVKMMTEVDEELKEKRKKGTLDPDKARKEAVELIHKINQEYF